MMYRKLSVQCLLLFLVVSCLTSCQTQKGWVYKPNKWTKVEKNDQKLVIGTFADERPSENTNAQLMYLVPFVPYGWLKFATPELYQGHANSGLWLNYDPKVDFAKSLTREVKDGTRFNEVIYTENQVDTGYYIQGRIINTNYKSKMFSYGLSYCAPVLWFIGLPACSFSNDLALELTCYAPGNKIVLQKEYKASYKATMWVYHNKSDFEYANLLKKVYSEFIRDLNKKIASK